VVDDDEINRLLLQRVLEGRGFTVEAVPTGMAALAALDRRRPDLVLLDIMMPGMSGIEVLDRVKASPRLATIPIIMLTAKEGDEDVLTSYRAGADYYLTKPLVVDQLLTGLTLVLGRRMAPPPDAPPPTPPHPDRRR
jgi:CheY-like chemotaxis protein